MSLLFGLGVGAIIGFFVGLAYRLDTKSIDQDQIFFAQTNRPPLHFIDEDLNTGYTALRDWARRTGVARK